MQGCNNLGKKYVGTEHILIGILSEEDNFAIRFIKELGVDITAITSDALEVSGVQTQDINDMASGERTGSNSKNTKIATLQKYGRDLRQRLKKER